MLDVCLVVESEGRLANGGIPESVYEMIKTLYHIRFAVVVIAHRSYATTSLLKRLPENIHILQIISLEESYAFSLNCPQKKRWKEFWEQVYQLYEAPLEEKIRFFEPVMSSLIVDEKRVLSYADLARSNEFFELLKRQYNKYCADSAFLDYVWIFRQTQLPYFQLTQFKLPKANIYHVFNSRYACAIGLMEKIRSRSHLVVDLQNDYFINHSINNSRQRILEEWYKRHTLSVDSLDIFTKIYNNSLRTNRFLAGFYADTIIVNENTDLSSAFAKGLEYKTCCIPSCGQFTRETLPKKTSQEKINIGFISELIPEADGKTCLRAARLLLNWKTGLRFHFYACGEINPFIAEEYTFLRTKLDLEFEFSFHYGRDGFSFLQNLDILVLAGRLAEDQRDLPLLALALGIPIIVQGWLPHRALIEGTSAADRELGECGFYLDAGSPVALAKVIKTLLTDSVLYKEMSKIAIKRFEKFYSKTTHLNSYISLYHNLV